MEDGFPLFDPNNEAERQEQRLKEYYEEFSANARKRLLAKTVIRPTTVYDVLYPQAREALLAKNIPFNTDLEEDAKIIRDRLIAKIISNETDLEIISANFRKSLVARAKIQEDKINLLQQGESHRKNLIAKNTPNTSNLEKDSDFIRRDNQAKNKQNPSFVDNIDKNSSIYRNNELSKNTSKNQDLLRDSEAFRNQFRINDVHKNVPFENSIDKNSEAYRKNNLSKNIVTENYGDLQSDSKLIRDANISKNRIESNDLEESSEGFRKSGLAKNVSKEQDLLRDSESIRNQFRINDLNKNTPIKSDIEKDSANIRRDNLSRNKSEITDLEADSIVYRNKNVGQGKNSQTPTIDNYADSERSDELSRNKSNVSDLESISIQFRKDDLSLNKPNKSDLEKESAQFRVDDLSLNKPKTTDLEKESIQFRTDDLSFNKPKTSNLEIDSEQFRKDDLSFNKLTESDIETDSIQFRKDDLSFNKSVVTDLEKDSAHFREDDLSFNKPKITDLEKDSAPFRADDLSFNKPKITDLETDSAPFREDDLSFNTPKITDLERDSVPFREDDLSHNSPKITDLATDSVPFREDDLSFNVPSLSDLATDSTPFLYNNLSANVPNNSDLEEDSVQFREDDLAANVPSLSNLLIDSEDFRNDDIAANIPNNSDLATDSAPFRALELAANVPSNSNIASDSVPFREDNLSSNISSASDLLIDSASIRKDAIAKNKAFGLLGVNIEGAGTSAFLGISRVFTQGILVRQLLFSKNNSKNTNLLLDSETFRDNNKIPNKWQISNNEYTSTNQNWTLGKIMQGSINTNIVNYDAIEPYYTPTAKAIFATDDYITTKGREMQDFYGTSQRVDFPTGRRQRTINDALFSVNSNNAKGGEFLDPFFKRQTYVNFLEGRVTTNIRNYNLERSAFNLYNLQVGSTDSLNALNNFAQDGFQELIAQTIGTFHPKFQSRTLTTPTNIIQKNGGTYYNGGAKDIDLLRPGTSNEELGSAESMMAKTVIGNPFEDEDFFAGRRGVRHIVNTIKAGNPAISGNFDPQNNKAYIVGMNRDGSARVSRQRFTIANPYAPGEAGKLIFYLKNYASGEQYFFPPYIQSFQNTENANWNSTNFLGRPEAVYTYNNSSRDASISFYVLTDYAQKVDIGRNWNSEEMEAVTANISSHFTQSDHVQNQARKLKEQELQRQKQELKEKSDEINKKLEQNTAEAIIIEQSNPEIEPTGTSGWADQMGESIRQVKEKQQQVDRKKRFEQLNNSAENAELTSERNEINKNIGNLESTMGDIDAEMNRPTNYSETNNIGNNIYNINITKKEYNNGEIICKPEDTINRINTMKAGLMFQPAFFSGDKVDFVRKVEFLSKMTRPAANEDGSETGFSFTKPPVCHIHLGDWWNHDIVVNSVSFDYSDAPWTLEGGRVQPMWVLVSINFNIIGPFKAHGARPPLATDAGGMYSPIGGITSA